ncbi:MAG: FtsX-like permease family protein [Candidatus Margulisiibacteriota bacterium]|jgi:putative ABC transport system permease protein
MNLLYYLQNAVFNLRQNLIKSIILIISMVFAIAPLIIIFSLERGSNAILYDQFQKLGLDLIQASSEKPINPAIFKYKKYFQALSTDTETKYINTVIMGKQIQIMLKPVDADYLLFNSTDKMLFGSFVRDVDVALNNPVCVIENHVNLPKPYLLPPIVGQKLTLKGKTYKIIGEYLNNSTLEYQSSVLPQFLVPINNQDYKKIKNVMVKAKNFQEIDATAYLLRSILYRYCKLNSNIDIQYNLESIKTTKGILDNIKVGLIIGAMVAFLIGGMGLSNIMLISVRDRTSEIGILKAIGAENKTILFQFLIEASFIGVIGSFFGIITGIIICTIVSFIIGVALPITLISILISFSAAFLLGVVFGMIPARKAAKMKIVDAIRFD